MRLNLIWTTLFAVVFVTNAGFQVHAQKREKCPDYMSSIVYLPISYLSFEDAPAKIIFTSDGGNEVEGKFRVGVGLRNLSSKTITEVKFQWYLFPNNIQLEKNILAEERATFLEKILVAQNEISVVDLKEFQPYKELEIQTKLPCEEISAAVANIGNVEKLATEFIVSPERLAMEFVVSEISFSDGSNWKRK